MQEAHTLSIGIGNEFWHCPWLKLTLITALLPAGLITTATAMAPLSSTCTWPFIAHAWHVHARAGMQSKLSKSLSPVHGPVQSPESRFCTSLIMCYRFYYGGSTYTKRNLYCVGGWGWG